jgi:hypothetical protein
MSQQDTAQMLAALGIPAGPGIPLPAGSGNTGTAPAAMWADPQRAKTIRDALMVSLGPIPQSAQLGRATNLPGQGQVG